MTIKISRERIHLLFQLSRVNLRYSVISLIGLTIAISFLAVGSISLDSKKADFFLEVINTRSRQPQESFSLYSLSIHELQPELLSEIYDNISRYFPHYNLEEYLIPSLYRWYTEIDHKKITLRDDDTRVDVFGLELNDSFLDWCTNGSRLPLVADEFLFFTPDANLSINFGDSINFSINYYAEANLDTEQPVNISLTVAGFLSPSLISDPNPFFQYKADFNHPVIFMEIHHFLTYFQSLTTNISTLTGFTQPFETKTEFSFNFNPAAVTRANILPFISDYNRYLERAPWQDIHGSFQGDDNSLDLNRQDSLSYLKYESRQFQLFAGYRLFFLEFIIPVVFISILLVNFSLNLSYEGRRRNLVLFRMRGLSTSFLVALLSFETLFLGFISSILGIICGVILVQLFGTATGFLSFSATFTPPYLSPSAIQTTIFYGLVLTSIAQIPNLIRILRSKLIEFEHQVLPSKSRKPRILSGRLDLALLLMGLSGIIFLYFFVQILFQPQTTSFVIMYALFPLFLILAVFAPVFFLIGFILAFNRLIPVLLDRMGRIAWNKDRKLLAISLRNLKVNQRFTVRTSFLIACALAFLMILSSLPISFVQYNIDRSFYKFGSDVKIAPPDDGPEIISNITSQLRLISGLTTTVVTRSNFWTENFRINMLGIDEDFSEAAFWRSWFDDNTLDALVSTLYENSSEFIPVLILQSSARAFNFDVNDSFSIENENGSSQSLFIESLVDYWPGFRAMSEDEAGLITTRYQLSQLISVIHGLTHNYNSEIWGKISSSVNYESTIEQARQVARNFGLSNPAFDIVSDQYSYPKPSFELSFFWSVVNFNFIGCLGVVLTLLVHYNIFQTSDRKTEIGLSRALGMKHPKVFKLLILEPIFLLLVSGLPGAFIGSFLLIGIVTILQPLTSLGEIPFPFHLTFDLPVLLFLYGSIIIVTLISGLILSFLSTRVNVVKILEVE